MCTYNGAAYLREQLDSLAAQTCRPLELVVCDDGSSDGTVGIVRDFAAVAPFPVHLHENPKRLGYVRNFEQALDQCRGTHVALCDQDDIWRIDKLALEMQAMNELEMRWSAEAPLLVYSDLSVTDDTGAAVHPSFMVYSGLRFDIAREHPLQALMVANFITGCTMLINRRLLEIARPFPPHAFYHDWWLALCAGAAGRLQFIDAPLVAYRVHGANASAPTAHRWLTALASFARHIASADARSERWAVQERLFCQAWAARKRLAACALPVPALLESFLTGLQRGGIRGFRDLCGLQLWRRGRLRKLRALWFCFYAATVAGRYDCKHSP